MFNFMLLWKPASATPLVNEVALEEAKRKNRKNDDENDENESVVGSSSSASKTISAALALALIVGVLTFS